MGETPGSIRQICCARRRLRNTSPFCCVHPWKRCPICVNEVMAPQKASPKTGCDSECSTCPGGAPRLDHRDGIENAETKREFLTRIYRVFQLIESRPDPVQVIVTHGYAMTFVVACWIGMPLESAGLVNFRSSPGSITHLHEDDVYFNRNVMQLNDNSHLK